MTDKKPMMGVFYKGKKQFLDSNNSKKERTFD